MLSCFDLSIHGEFHLVEYSEGAVRIVLSEGILVTEQLVVV